MNDFGSRVRPSRVRYFRTGADRAKLKRLLEVECMNIAEAAEEMKIPEYVVLAAAERYGIAFFHRRTYWTERDNSILKQWFRKLSMALPEKTDRQITNRLVAIYRSRPGEDK